MNSIQLIKNLFSKIKTILNYHLDTLMKNYNLISKVVLNLEFKNLGFNIIVMEHNINNFYYSHKEKDLYNLKYLFLSLPSLIPMIFTTFLIYFKFHFFFEVLSLFFSLISPPSPFLSIDYQFNTKNKVYRHFNFENINTRVRESNILVLDNIDCLNIKVHLLVTIEVLILKVLYNLNLKFYLISPSIDDQINIARNQFLRAFNNFLY